MPVDQSGENIVFRISGGFVEAHIQIQYTGNPRRFAWLIPVPSVPTVSVGSEPLFRSLLSATVPTVQLQTSYSCNGVKVGGCGFGMGASDSRSSAMDHTPTSNPIDTRLAGTAVGAFDVTIVKPTNAADVVTWLETNGFIVGTQAPAIVSDYVAQGHVFVAVKLLPDAGSDEIHPLVIRYAGNRPCIPLKLTSIAAVPDMGVRAFFLGDSRVVPTNYREVTLNLASLDWKNPGSSYGGLVSLAVDARGADGHAFVPEYAGPSSVVSTSGIYDPSWNADAFKTMPREGVLGELVRQGLLTCASLGCTAKHPLLMPLLAKYLPGSVSPSGTLTGTYGPGPTIPGCTPADSGIRTALMDGGARDSGARSDAGPASADSGPFACVNGGAGGTAWNGPAFAAELSDRIVSPGQHAADLLASSTYLTRLFTEISPLEMTDDPEFVAASASTPVVNSGLSTTETFDCRGNGQVRIPGHTPLVLGTSGSWPRISGMPPEEKIVGYDASGHVVPIVDQRATIESSITGFNASQPQLDFGDPSGRSACGCSFPVGTRVPPLVTSGIALIVLAARRKRRRAAR